MNKINVVSLFDPLRGSRYPLMINQGLISRPNVNVWANADVKSLGALFAPGLNEKDLKPIMKDETDFILVPSPEHFIWGDYMHFIDENNLWSKVICYDFSDSSDINPEIVEKVRLYVKRSYDQEKHDIYGTNVFWLPYGVLLEY